MKKNKKMQLENKGYKFTNTQEFLKLTDQEIEIIDLKIKLVKKLRIVRKSSGITQKQLAKLMNSSQSRIAMIENGASDISIDLICKALFILGVTHKELGRTISAVKVA